MCEYEIECKENLCYWGCRVDPMKQRNCGISFQIVVAVSIKTLIYLPPLSTATPPPLFPILQVISDWWTRKFIIIRIRGILIDFKKQETLCSTWEQQLVLSIYHLPFKTLLPYLQEFVTKHFLFILSPPPSTRSLNAHLNIIQGTW